MMLYLVVHTHGGELIQGDHHAFTQVATTCIAIQHVETVNVLEALQQKLLPQRLHLSLMLVYLQQKQQLDPVLIK